MLRNMLHHLRIYMDAWLTTVSARHNRQRLCLDLLLCVFIQGLTLHRHAQRAVQLTGSYSTNTVDGHSSACQGSDPQLLDVSSPLLRSVVRVLSVRSSLTSLAIDTSPGGCMPTELVLLAMYTSAILIVCVIVVAPSFWLQRRSHIFLLASLLINSVCMSSLVTHPDSEPSHHWRTFLPSAGAGLVWKQLIFRVRKFEASHGGSEVVCYELGFAGVITLLLCTLVGFL